MSETKAFGIVDVDIKATDPDDPAGSFEAILSAPTVDRDGEVIDPKAFEPLPDHITIDIDHGMSVATTVGSGVPYYEGDLLKFRGSFSTIARAQEVRTLVTEGHIRKMSVAFMNAKREDDPDDERPHIRRAELLNAAIVPIPSNREASILAAKAHAATVNGERLTSEARKAVAGSYEERQNRLREALLTAHPAAKWLWIRATFSDSVVFDVESETGPPITFRCSYEETDGLFTFGQDEEVDLAEVIVPPAGKSSTDTDPEPAAAPAAAAPADVTLDPKALAALAEAESLLA